MISKCQQMSYCDVIDTWATSNCGITREWLFWRCFYERFHHHNGVASQGSFSMAAYHHNRHSMNCRVLICFHLRIEINHSYSLACCCLCCYSGTVLVEPAATAMKLPAPLVLCQSCSTNHSSANHIVVESYNNHLMAITQEMPETSITKISLNITSLTFLSNLPGNNGLKYMGIQAA